MFITQTNVLFKHISAYALLCTDRGLAMSRITSACNREHSALPLFTYNQVNVPDLMQKKYMAKRPRSSA